MANPSLTSTECCDTIAVINARSRFINNTTPAIGKPINRKSRYNAGSQCIELNDNFRPTWLHATRTIATAITENSVMTVAHAAPAIPSAFTPKPPKINQGVNAALITSAAIAITAVCFSDPMIRNTVSAVAPTGTKTSDNQITRLYRKT